MAGTRLIRVETNTPTRLFINSPAQLPIGGLYRDFPVDRYGTVEALQDVSEDRRDTRTCLTTAGYDLHGSACSIDSLNGRQSD